jgi:ribosomal RNA-processing protein 36
MKQSRDPRFLPLAGEFSAEKFQVQYGFIADAHKAELDTLRQNLKRAKKLLSTSPQNLFIERDQEVKRLELAVKRAESMVNKDNKDTTERQALLKLTKEEREKRKQGKKRWWMKECK